MFHPLNAHGIIPFRVFPIVHSWYPFRFGFPALRFPNLLNVRLLPKHLGLLRIAPRLPPESPVAKLIWFPGDLFVFKVSPCRRPYFCHWCYPITETDTLLGFCLSMAFPLAVRKLISQFYPSCIFSHQLPDDKVYSKGLCTARLAFLSCNLRYRGRMPAILRFLP